MSTTTPETFNLTLPVHAFRGQYRWMTDTERAAYDAVAKRRVAALIALLQAISPELAALTPHVGGFRELLTFRFTTYQPALSVAEIATGQLEVRLENGRRNNTTRRRVKVDRDTGAIDPRIVTVVREMVAEAKAIMVREAAAKAYAISEAEVKAAAFAHSETVITSLGLKWRYGIHNHEGVVDLPGQYNRANIKGRAAKAELNLDVDHLPALVAFVKGLTEAKPDKRIT